MASSIGDLRLSDFEQIRMVLRGGSVVDWRRLYFAKKGEVDQFLAVAQFNPNQPFDREWLRTILADAVEYLRRTYSYRVAETVANPSEIQDLFLTASGAKNPRLRKIACIVLKVMHVIQHIEARDLRFKLAVSEAVLAQLLTTRVRKLIEEAKASGFPIVDFADSIKTRAATITKLIAKRDATAGRIFDRTRFRVTVETVDDVVPMLCFLTDHLIPFNSFIPDQTDNSLIYFAKLVAAHPDARKLAERFHVDLTKADAPLHSANHFSGSTYRMLSFVADVPIRVDGFLPSPEEDQRSRKSRVTLATCEFQICDRRARIENERGENAHDRYKARQRSQVLNRLANGLVLPKLP